MEVVTGSPAETEALAARLARGLRPGDVVEGRGEFGGGQTTFVRGAARALGVEQPVSSPTFTIGHRYDAPVPVAHLDLYRIAGLDSEEWGDLEPYFDGTIAFVEWPEHGGDWLPEARVGVTLGHVDESPRSVTLECSWVLTPPRPLELSAASRAAAAVAPSAPATCWPPWTSSCPTRRRSRGSWSAAG